MDFSEALRIIRSGGIVVRQCWNGTGLTLGVMAFPAETNITPFLALRAPNGTLTPWAPGNPELFADDWRQVEREREAGNA